MLEVTQATADVPEDLNVTRDHRRVLMAELQRVLVLPDRPQYAPECEHHFRVIGIELQRASGEVFSPVDRDHAGVIALGAR